jgi:hypothetical protein
MNQQKTPISYWIISIIGLLWNSVGAFDYVMTKTRNAEYLKQFTPEQIVYFESFPLWGNICWGLGVWGAVAGSLLLLLRSRHAVLAFMIALVGLAGSTANQFMVGEKSVIDIIGPVAIYMTIAIWLITFALFLFSRKSKSNGILR